MSLSLNDIVSFDARPGGSVGILERAPRLAHISASRRSFLRGALVAGSAVGLTVLGWLPTSRRAWASHPDDDMKPGGCEGLGTWVDNDDCNGCNETRPHCCCDVSSNWHIHTDSGSYKLRPNECDPGDYDGWNWTYFSCCPNGRKNQTWRCHDGFRRQADGTDQRTICKHRTFVQEFC